MQMHGSRLLNASAEQAWQALNDPEILKQCIPGCQSFEATGPTTYQTSANIKIGPVSAKFTGQVALTNIQAPHSYAINFDAQGGVAGHGKGSAHVELHENETGVELRYSVESQIGGKLAQIGQRLVDGAAKSMADDFFKRFEQALQNQIGHTDNATVSSAETPTNTDSTPDIEGIPTEPPIPPTETPSFPKWLWVAVAVSVIMILIVI